MHFATERADIARAQVVGMGGCSQLRTAFFLRRRRVTHVRAEFWAWLPSHLSLAFRGAGRHCWCRSFELPELND
jgi:hypothetical protein